MLESAWSLRDVFIRENEFFRHTSVSGGMHKGDRAQLMSTHLALPGPNDQVISSCAEEGKPT